MPASEQHRVLRLLEADHAGVLGVHCELRVFVDVDERTVDLRRRVGARGRLGRLHLRCRLGLGRRSLPERALHVLAVGAAVGAPLRVSAPRRGIRVVRARQRVGPRLKHRREPPRARAVRALRRARARADAALVLAREIAVERRTGRRAHVDHELVRARLLHNETHRLREPPHPIMRVDSSSPDVDLLRAAIPEARVNIARRRSARARGRKKRERRAASSARARAHLLLAAVLLVKVVAQLEREHGQAREADADERDDDEADHRARASHPKRGPRFPQSRAKTGD